MKYLIAYLAAGTAFLVLDLLWLGLVAKPFYRAQIGALMLERFNMPAALLFYVCYLGGIVIFATAPALHNDSWRYAIVFGALFGLFTYGTYDMTNLATLRGWTVPMVIVDVTWGTFLAGVSATAGFAAGRLVG